MFAPVIKLEAFEVSCTTPAARAVRHGAVAAGIAVDVNILYTMNSKPNRIGFLGRIIRSGQPLFPAAVLPVTPEFNSTSCLKMFLP